MKLKDTKGKNDSNTIFIPIILGSEVIQLNINEKSIPLKRKISLQDFTDKLIPLLTELDKFIDFNYLTFKSEGLSEIFKRDWDENSLKKFWNNFSDKQKMIIKLIFLNKKISREKLIEMLIEKNHLRSESDPKKQLAGVVAGMTRKWNSQRFKPIFFIKNNLYISNLEINDLLINILKSEINE